jgi:hypothetical protein
MNDREAFEKIVLILLGNAHPWLEKYTTDEFNGQYVNGSVQEARQHWQAAIAHKQAEIEALKAQLAEREWVSVDDRLPDDETYVDVYIKSTENLDYGRRVCEVLFITERKQKFKTPIFHPAEYVSHWMPLPEPPKEI